MIYQHIKHGMDSDTEDTDDIIRMTIIISLWKQSSC